ncbi:MAG: hypothetical protein N2169_04030 [bacterium]|nr:hypothetical protein [bacterium]
MQKIVYLFIFFLFSFTYSINLYKMYSVDDVEAYYLDNFSESNGLIVCSIHGNEPLAYEVVKEVLFNSNDYFSKDFNYCIVLQPSRYRIANRKRTTFEGLDPNRTFINLFSNSSIFIVSAIKKYKPVFIIDIHQAKRENIDFMYSFGDFCKVMLNLYKVDEFYRISESKIYTPFFYSLKSLQKELEDQSVQLFISKGIKVSKYVPLNRDESYSAVSILRNYGAASGIFSVLFELSYSDNSAQILRTTLRDYVQLMSKNHDKLKDYIQISKKLESEYFRSRYFLIPLKYDAFERLVNFIDSFGIDYYLTVENFDVFDNVWEFGINKAELKDIPEFKNFVYLNLDVTIKKVKLNKVSCVIKGGVISSFILNPIYGESVWNFSVFPYSKNYLPFYIGIDGKDN